MTRSLDTGRQYQSSIGYALGVVLESLGDLRDVVAPVVAFANGDTTPPGETRLARVPDEILLSWYENAEDDELIEQLEYAMEHGCWAELGHHLDHFEFSDTLDQRKAAEVGLARIHQEQEFAVDVLSSAASGTDALISKVRELLADKRLGMLNMALRPVISSEAVRLEWKITGNTMSARPWISTAAVWLAANARGGQTDVGRCHLDSCRRFFVIDWKASNRPRTKYCTPEHRIQHDKELATERRRRSRKRIKPTRPRRK